jgi:hypothetical protein
MAKLSLGEQAFSCSWFHTKEQKLGLIILEKDPGFILENSSPHNSLHISQRHFKGGFLLLNGAMISFSNCDIPEAIILKEVSFTWRPKFRVFSTVGPFCLLG